MKQSRTWSAIAPEIPGIRRVVIDNRAVLYQGDCLEVLPKLGKVDAVVTDPPYGLGERMQGGTWGAADKYADFRRWDRAPSQDTIARLWMMAPQAIIWGGNYFDLPPSRCWLAWDKCNAVPTMADLELAWTSLDRPAKRISLPVGVHRYGHPTEKPLALLAWCLRFATGAVVADPFMGSGTTGVACLQLDRLFIGVEIDPGYFEIACKRIRAAANEPRLPLAEPAQKAVQEAMP